MMADSAQDLIDYGESKGKEIGAQKNALENIRSLMKNTGWSASKIMDAMGIPKEDQVKYAALLQVL